MIHFQYPTWTRSSALVFLVVVSAHLSGCASLEKTEMGRNLSELGTGIGSGVKKGFKKVTAYRPGKSGKNIGDANAIAAKFPLDQAPHTIMKKPVAEGRLSSGFGYRINPKGVRIPKRHKGIDYAAPRGTAIYAAADGVIEKIYVSKSYGNYIRIEHENDFFTAYAHMNAFADGLEKGTPVSRGQIIGQVGDTGRSSGPHLHFELIHAGKFIDPLFELEAATIAKGE